MKDPTHDPDDPHELAQPSYEADLTDRLCAALVDATGGRIQSCTTDYCAAPGLRLDRMLSLVIDDEFADIAVQTLRHAYPRDIREAVWKLDEYRLAPANENVVPLIAAESLSPGARELLRKRGIGYFERNGNLCLRWRTWIIDIVRPEPEGSRRYGFSLFSDSREKVAHALLVHPGKWLTGKELAELSQTSPYTCSVVMQELERREWCEPSGAGRTLKRRLTEPRQLLDAWAEYRKDRNEPRSGWYLFEQRPNLLLSQLASGIEEAGIDMKWAFSGTAAANVYAPLLTRTDTAEIIVPPGHTAALAKSIGLKRAEKGANVVLVEREGASLLFRDKHPEYPAWFVSPFILYLDLLDGRGRNAELAKHVLDTLAL